MGISLSIDKYVSQIDDILEMTPSYFDKIMFESKISPDITQHLKVTKILFIVSRYGDLLKTRGR